MDEKDKKEIIKMFGDVLEQNVLPAMEGIVDGLRNDLKKDIGDLDEKVDRMDRKLQDNIDRFDKKFDNHEGRIAVLEGKKRR